jgi:hypothetical protein
MEGQRRGLEGRVKEELACWLAEMRCWTVWGTLTVDPKRSRPLEYWSEDSKAQYRREAQEGRGRAVARDVMVRMVRGSFAVAEELVGHRIDYVACLEAHRSGALHAHAMVDTGEQGKDRQDIRALWEPWYSRYGYCLFEPPRDVLNAAEYAARHLVKGEAADLVLSKGLGRVEIPRVRRLV